MNALKPGLYPSLFAAPQLNIADAMDQIDAHVSGWHVDIMDLQAVHNIALNFETIKELQQKTKKSLFIHLMVTQPIAVLALLTLKNGDIITLHANRFDLGLLLPAIAKAGCHAFLALSPEDPVSLVEPYFKAIAGILVMGVKPGLSGQKPALDIVERVAEVKLMCKELNENPIIAVDGAITQENAHALTKAGASILCAGSAIFGSEDFAQNAQQLLVK